MTTAPRERAHRFCARFSMTVPVLEAPMAGSCPPARAAAVTGAGGMAGLGAFGLAPPAIARWFKAFRAAGGGAVQANLWVRPETAPSPDREREARARAALAAWGPPPPGATEAQPFAAFDDQFAAIVAARPTALSTTMGLLPPTAVERLRAVGIAWFAAATTCREARAAEAAGADAVVAQGVEAGGHRAGFDPDGVDGPGIGLVSLTPRLADMLSIPVIAAGGIADGRGIAAALVLGASAVQVGTALLLADEADTPPAWRDAIRFAEPEDMILTRAFTGRQGRAIGNRYVDAHPPITAFPLQRALTGPMRAAATARGDRDAMQMWAGQSAATARPGPAADLVARWWIEAQALLS